MDMTNLICSRQRPTNCEESSFVIWDYECCGYMLEKINISFPLIFPELILSCRKLSHLFNVHFKIKFYDHSKNDHTYMYRYAHTQININACTYKLRYTQREKHALIHIYAEFDASNPSNAFLAMPIEVTNATKDI